MPRSNNTRVIERKENFNLANAIGVAIIGLLVSLVGTGVVSMVVLNIRVATLTEAETRTEQQLARHLDHSVDRDAYEKRDTAIQKMLNDKASKDEMLELRDEVRTELVDLKEMMRSIQDALPRHR